MVRVLRHYSWPDVPAPTLLTLHCLSLALPAGWKSAPVCALIEFAKACLARYGLMKTKHTAESVQCIHRVNGEALEGHLLFSSNYPDNIWRVVWMWEGPGLAFQCAVRRRSTSWSKAVARADLVNLERVLLG